MPWGTLVNVAAVIAGSAAGLWLRRGLPDRLRGIIFQGIGLATLLIGMLNAWAVTAPVPDQDHVARHLIELIMSILLGGLTGEWLNLEKRLEAAGDWLKARVRSRDSRFTEGLVTAFLIYCIGPMTLMGALNEGIRGDAGLLYAKSVLDGFMSIALASTYGIGVAFSILPLFLFQVGIMLLGTGLGEVLSDVVINQLTAVGGLLILGLGLNLLEVTKLRIANLLPALVVVVGLALLFG
ncbi:DUF554 domain-containing protein [bacterium]|nr:DUF554 domain-containing protein [bacterium]